jgi:hypothetical protein
MAKKTTKTRDLGNKTMHQTKFVSKSGKKFEVNLRQTAGGFTVYALMKFPKDADGNHVGAQRGLVTTHQTVEDAQTAFDAVVADAAAKGWKMAAKVTKSTFDTVPSAD